MLGLGGIAGALLFLSRGTPFREGRARGIDVSHHQGSIEWRRVAQDDVVFAYIKATEGGDFVDPRFRDNWNASAAAGLPRGAYHFFTRCRSGEAQAANFIRVVPVDPAALPHALDLEHMGPCRDGPMFADVAAEATIFLDRVQAHYGRRPVVYTTRAFHEHHLREVRGEQFWLRSMWSPPDFRADDWTLWQHSATGEIDGIEGDVDLNLFQGDQAAFRRWAARSE